MADYNQFERDIYLTVTGDKKIDFEKKSVTLYAFGLADELLKNALNFSDTADELWCFYGMDIDLRGAKRVCAVCGGAAQYEALRDCCAAQGAELRAVIMQYHDSSPLLFGSDIYISDAVRALGYVSVFGEDGIYYHTDDIRKMGWSETIPPQDARELAYAAENKPDEVFVFSDAKTEEFDRLRRLQLMILDELDRVCRENRIRYFLGGGTLLGAARHGGFIPWDYDIDVMFTPKNYRKLCKCADKFDKRFFLQTPDTEPNNHFFSKLRLNGTVMTTEMTEKLDINKGIFIDLFEHPYTANTRYGQRLHILATRLVRSLVYNKWMGTPVRGAKGSDLGKASKALATFLKTVLPMSVLEKLQFTVIGWFVKPTKWLYDGKGQNLNKGAFPAEWMYSTAALKFEGKKRPVPVHYADYLGYLYGDYSEPIQVSKRHISHDIITLDFGEYSNY